MGDYNVVVLDFETTGLSPDGGDRVIEVGAVLVSNNSIVDRFDSLMNPGMRISSFIEAYTGISNGMLATAPPVVDVMERFAVFIAGHQLVAHNAGFDRRFLDAELARINRRRCQEFACSMLTARRIYPDAPNHRLEALVRHRALPTNGVHHRALADAEMTAHLWIAMVDDLKERYGLRHVPFQLMQDLATVPRKKAPEFLRGVALRQGQGSC
jgi:DNA polymerase-3 subunit epsilon